MVYSSSPDVRARVPGVAPGEGEAGAFVQRLVMQTLAVFVVGMPQNCIVVGNTVTGICTKMPQTPPAAMMCNGAMETAANPPQHLTVRGTTSTTNIIMANWSRTTWQSEVNRVVRMLASGPLGSNFFSASAVVSGS
ncbi:hypothetical protein KIN20_021090 [Parelaphostrongylus tenuis]|uniref:Uncharacterized protein n=1 Tax=Parelaphostrongylus tenuis TaxID=148309 RepID=A0AAD5MNE2_PARTN|nr:hypothetical protein KIN20_021090 [Parelaphostrongylus tenuis]